MRALTIRQPWATLVSCGLKRVETRTWGTAHRGELAIHAGKGMDAMPGIDLELYHRASQGRGCIVAVAQLVDVVEMTEAWLVTVGTDERRLGGYEAGRFGWVLADVRALSAPVPCRGALSLWTTPADVEALVRRGLAP